MRESKIFDPGDETKAPVAEVKTTDPTNAEKTLLTPINRTQNQTIKLFIKSYIDEDLKKETHSIESGQELYSELFTRFSSRCEKDGRTSRHQFFNIKKGNLSISKLFTEVEKLAGDMKICLGEGPSLNDKIDQILKVLPIEYADEARIIAREMDFFNALWEVQERLEQVEELIKMKATTTNVIKNTYEKKARKSNSCSCQ